MLTTSSHSRKQWKKTKKTETASDSVIPGSIIKKGKRVRTPDVLRDKLFALTHVLHSSDCAI